MKYPWDIPEHLPASRIESALNEGGCVVVYGSAPEITTDPKRREVERTELAKDIAGVLNEWKDSNIYVTISVMKRPS